MIFVLANNEIIDIRRLEPIKRRYNDFKEKLLLLKEKEENETQEDT